MDNKGFTIIEIMVSLLLFSILVSISVCSVLSWQDHTSRTKNDECAQDIFMIAQKQLTSLEEKNILDIFRDKLKYCKKLDSDELIGDKRIEKITLTCLIADKDDYSRYLAGEKTSSDSAGYLFELIKDSIGDPDILNSSICIEIDTEYNRVSSVLFSETALSFSYNERPGAVSITDRSLERRIKQSLGYYGAFDK